MHCHKPTFTVLSVTDIRTTFNCGCSFNWNRRTDGNFELSFITSAHHTREFLGSRPGRFISVKTGQYLLTTRLCGPKSQSGNFVGERIHSSLPEFKPWDSPAHSLIRRNTARFSSRNSKYKRLVTYWQMVVAMIPAVLCILP